MLIILYTSIILVTSAPYLTSDFSGDVAFNIPDSKDGLDVILTLLPVYGWVKLSYILKQRTIDQIMVFINLFSLKNR